jgi:hypothetical protein
MEMERERVGRKDVHRKMFLSGARSSIYDDHITISATRERERDEYKSIIIIII